ncbi:hypothetical protein [Rhizobium sp. RU35A]|uniref:hypothetical protein n=1 Tax=Rhizobium sp. RU35A TaxID=1907414 RepID=UPI00122C6522|nr:hypothetical protein [Rhizobium sp. RU35A]
MSLQPFLQYPDIHEAPFSENPDSITRQWALPKEIGENIRVVRKLSQQSTKRHAAAHKIDADAIGRAASSLRRRSVRR